MICQGASCFNGSAAITVFKNFAAQVDSLKKLYADLLTAGMFFNEINEFKRMSRKSKQCVLTAALALFDANILPADDCGNIAVVISDNDCCSSDNKRYFLDYIKYGRVMGRGNLFVNTLPTTPAAEISMALNLHGPLYFTSAVDNPVAGLLQDAELLLDSGDADKVMVVFETSEGLTVMVFAPGKSGEDYCKCLKK